MVGEIAGKLGKCGVKDTKKKVCFLRRKLSAISHIYVVKKMR